MVRLKRLRPNGLVVIMLILSTLLSTLFANKHIVSETDFIFADERYNIDYRLLYSLAKVESGCNKYAIGAYTKKRVLAQRAVALMKKTGIKFKHHHETYIAVYPKDEKEFHTALAIIKKNRLKYDVGIMQISSGNIENNNWKIDDLLSTEYNISTGASILRECFDRSKDVYKALECYNKGFKKTYSWSHSNKVVSLYKKMYKGR